MRAKETMYYILTKDHGDYAIFWREKSAGYTRQLEKAGRYTKEEADRICGIRGLEYAVPCAEIEKIAVRVVDCGEAHKLAAIKE